METNETEVTEEQNEEKEETLDIKQTPEYIAMKEFNDKQTKELEKLQKENKELKLTIERKALQFSGKNEAEELDDSFLAFSKVKIK